MSDRVHFHMSGADSVSPLYQLDPGYTGDVTDIESWAQEEINRGLGNKLLFVLLLINYLNVYSELWMLAYSSPHRSRQVYGLVTSPLLSHIGLYNWEPV